MTRNALMARREALIGQPFYVQFYGSWYAIEEATGRAKRAKSCEHAVTLAEAGNADHAADAAYEACVTLLDEPYVALTAHVHRYYFARFSADYQAACESAFCQAYDC